MKKLSFFAFFLYAGAILSQNVIPPASLVDLKGDEVNLREISRDNLVVFSLWATWCVPCINELEAIASLYPKWQALYDVKLFAISIDDARTVNRVRPMVKGKGWDYEFLLDSNNDLRRALGASTVPFTLIVKNNNILYSRVGYSPGAEDVLGSKLEEFSDQTQKE